MAQHQVSTAARDSAALKLHREAPASQRKPSSVDHAPAATLMSKISAVADWGFSIDIPYSIIGQASTTASGLLAAAILFGVAFVLSDFLFNPSSYGLTKPRFYQTLLNGVMLCLLELCLIVAAAHCQCRESERTRELGRQSEVSQVDEGAQE